MDSFLLLFVCESRLLSSLTAGHDCGYNGSRLTVGLITMGRRRLKQEGRTATPPHDFFSRLFHRFSCEYLIQKEIKRCRQHRRKD